MELAFVLLFVLIGTGAIVYAGLRQPARKPEPDPVPAADEVAPSAGDPEMPEAAEGESGGDD